MENRWHPIHGKVIPVFFYYCIPTVLGMLAVSSAQMIDGIFLGNYAGKTALAAVNLTLPMGAFMLGVALMFSIGGSVRYGKYLGEGDLESAGQVFVQTVVVTGAFCLTVCVFGLLFLDQLAAALGANALLDDLVKEYLRIFLLFNLFSLCGLCFYFFVRVDGRPLLASFALGLVAFVNVCLDWLFIGAWGMGVSGAALATGLSYMTAFFLLGCYFVWKRPEFFRKWPRRGFGEAFLSAYNGLSEFTNEISSGTITLLFNWIMIKRMGVDGVAAYTIVSYTLFVGLMISYGISDSMLPVVSRNFGAKRPDRIASFLRVAVFSSVSVGMILIFSIVTMPQIIADIFVRSTEKQTMEIAMRFLGFFWPTFLFVGTNINMSVYFTSMQKPLHSAIIAVSRSLIFPALFLLLLPPFLGDSGIFLAIPLSEACTFMLASSFFLRNRPSCLVAAEGTKDK